MNSSDKTLITVSVKELRRQLRHAWRAYMPTKVQVSKENSYKYTVEKTIEKLDMQSFFICETCDTKLISKYERKWTHDECEVLRKGAIALGNGPEGDPMREFLYEAENYLFKNKILCRNCEKEIYESSASDWNHRLTGRKQCEIYAKPTAT